MNWPDSFESVLRREKSMKDKDGRPIISLPKKHISSVELEFSKDESILYDALYKQAKRKFMGLTAQGTKFKCVFYPLAWVAGHQEAE